MNKPNLPNFYNNNPNININPNLKVENQYPQANMSINSILNHNSGVPNTNANPRPTVQNTQIKIDNNTNNNNNNNNNIPQYDGSYSNGESNTDENENIPESSAFPENVNSMFKHRTHKLMNTNIMEITDKCRWY
jgi:hypothetical protein